MQEVLKLENITMQFGGVVAVDSLSLVVNKGEIVCLIGPNGAGKTTAFNVVTGVYAPTNGAVYFNGNLIVENHPRGRLKKTFLGQVRGNYTKHLEPTPDKITKLGIARTFQNIRLWKSQSVFDNVLTAKHLRRTSNVFSATFRLNWREEQQQRKEVSDLLQMLDLYSVKDEICTGLPYGLQRRLEIARALATQPTLLLLDEPAAGMNPQETQDLTDFIKKIRADFDLTVFMIEHHMDLVMSISDRIYVLNFGALIATGTPEQVQSNSEVIAAYLGEKQNA